MRIFISMAPTAETEFRSLDREELMEAGITYFRLYRQAQEAIRKLEEVNRQLANEVGEKNQVLLWSQEYLETLKRLKFGPSSERRADSGGPLFAGKPEEKEEYETVRRKKRKKFGRRPQPELPVEQVTLTLSEEEQKKEGLRPMKDQFEEAELINLVPCRFVLQKIRRQKYSSSDPTNPRIVTAPGPVKLKEKSRYSLPFSVEVGLNKYQMHLPLERQVGWMKGFGLKTDTQTLFSQVDTIAWYLKASVMEMFQKELEHHQVHIADESPWGNLGKKKEAKKKFYLWAVRNARCTLFEIYDSRSQKIASNFLMGISGVLLTDGYAGYRALASSKLRLANDWSHLRRKFIGAEKNFPEQAKWMIDQIKIIAKIEKHIRGKPNDERLAVRQVEVKPIVEGIKEKLDSWHSVLPKSSLGKAVSYAQTLWSGLTVFLSEPEVPWESNSIERAIRSPVVGRKNHYGSHSLKTAEVAAIWYSVIETCKMHGVDPRAYLVDTLTRILTKQPVLAPWNWAAAQKKSE
jgi:transposase